MRGHGRFGGSGPDRSPCRSPCRSPERSPNGAPTERSASRHVSLTRRSQAFTRAGAKQRLRRPHTGTCGADCARTSRRACRSQVRISMRCRSRVGAPSLPLLSKPLARRLSRRNVPGESAGKKELARGAARGRTGPRRDPARLVLPMRDRANVRGPGRSRAAGRNAVLSYTRGVVGEREVGDCERGTRNPPPDEAPGVAVVPGGSEADAGLPTVVRSTSAAVAVGQTRRYQLDADRLRPLGLGRVRIDVRRYVELHAVVLEHRIGEVRNSV